MADPRNPTMPSSALPPGAPPPLPDHDPAMARTVAGGPPTYRPAGTRRWIWIGAVVVLLVLAIVMFAGGGTEPVVVDQPATQTVPNPPAASDPATTTPAPPADQ